jgi:hypothetical protein
MILIPASRPATVYTTFQFTNAVYINMHFAYSYRDGNARAASKEHKHQNPDQRQPIRHVFCDILQSEGKKCIHATADTGHSRYNVHNEVM